MKSDTKYALIRRWSTPSVSDYGIDQKYKQSDQHVWLIKCEHCGYDQEMTFDKNLIVKDESLIDQQARVVQPGATQYVCQKCGKSLESSRWYNGHWETRFGNEGRSVGFFVSQLNAVWLTSDQIYHDYLTADSKQIFYNYTLGQSYENASLMFQDKDVADHTKEYLPEFLNTRGDYAKVSVGIDWGVNYHHVVVLGMKGNGVWDIIDLQKVQATNSPEHIEEDLQQVIQIVERYDPDIICPDVGYSGNFVNRMINYFGKDKVFGVIQRTAKTNNDMNAHFNLQGNTVTIDKLMQNMGLLSEIKAGRIGFIRNLDDPMIQLFMEHWKNVVIKDEEDDKGNVYKTITRRGGD